MQLRSPAFSEGESIPPKYTCDGSDVSPPLQISGVPDGTAALALVMDDPDAPGGTFDHWLVWNIPPETAETAEGTEPDGVQGRTDFGKLGYGGPCPPGGSHTYRFKLYALDEQLDLAEGARKKDLQNAMQQHVLAECVLSARYSRQR